MRRLGAEVGARQREVEALVGERRAALVAVGCADVERLEPERLRGAALPQLQLAGVGSVPLAEALD